MIFDKTASTLDEETFRRFQRGEEAAAVEIFDLYHPRLLAYLTAQIHDRDFAEDLVQEVFLAAYHQRHSLQFANRFRSWLYSVAYNMAMKHHRSRQRHPVVSLDELNTENRNKGEYYQGTEQDQHLQEQHRKLVASILTTLPEDERQLLMLRYFGELSIKELAETLAMPMGTIGVKLSRSLDRLRKALEAKGYKPEDLFA